jgi:Lecithin retinol acyltransferase
MASHEDDATEATMTATSCFDAPPAMSQASPEPFALGAHLVTARRGYTHHGIYVGGGRVVHYAGWSRAKFTCRPVEEVSLEEFANGRGVAVRGSPARYTGQEVVARARSRLGEDRYRVASNNCEHFCHWCLSGEHRSAQVERFLGWKSSVMLMCSRMARAWIGAGFKPQTGNGC